MGLQSENLDPLVQRFLETKKSFAEEGEMVFSPTDGSHATKILENVRSLGWEGFVQNPGDYVAEIVLEFYANINKSERTSKIGGKIIPFNSVVLNDLYNFKDINDEGTVIKIEGKDEIVMAEAFKELCPDGVRSYYKNSWSIAFMVMLLYAIQRSLPINVGRMISDGIIASRFSNESKCLFYPSTITRLAEMFNVDMSNFRRVQSNYAIDQSYLSTLQPPRGIERRASHGQTSSESPELETNVQPMQTKTNIAPATVSSDILACLQQIMLKQEEMTRNWDVFKNEQVMRITHVMTELAQTRSSQKIISQTIDNQVAYTFPTIQMMGNLMWNVANAVRNSNIPNFQPYFVTDPGMSSFNGEGISVHPAQGLSMSMVSPPPIVFSERGEVSTAFPMSHTSHPFSVT
ncbi:hypothetical protein A4A49_27753 [Nicotiana attenuata]|uniref:Putative plant transposon protein domain-containing protein n=1 Tax=Nicotiana attenuata TaxID=49451 RepID=A0A314KQG2_NICAT|nr:hypothetical protein A4A49_27753 [Nicotiana attenuata]